MKYFILIICYAFNTISFSKEITIDIFFVTGSLNGFSIAVNAFSILWPIVGFGALKNIFGSPPPGTAEATLPASLADAKLDIPGSAEPGVCIPPNAAAIAVSLASISLFGDPIRTCL